MNSNRLGLSYLLIAALIFLVSGCSGNEQKNAEIIFYAEGENWDAQYKTNVTPTEKENVEINFFYKGSISELLAAQEIVFSYGTRNGNIAETLRYDKIDKTHFPIQFEGDLIQDIVGNHNEKMMVIIKWNNKSETLHLSQFEKKGTEVDPNNE
ncbi:hypothetical protein [Paenibacillus harenae]|uniref:hypothetical protein n=1 Tax=Paenibacillus harenae TaxID=306543 RepID=UPI0004216754|nr:hypothetical protein [Paenibacillus harenae]